MSEIKRAPALERKTCISYKTEEKTVVKGFDLGELAEKGYGFVDAMYVMFQSRIPSTNENLMLNYEMAEFLEHSMSPSAISAIAVETGRPMLPAAVASGIMTFGGAHGPGAAHSYMMDYYINRAREEGRSLKEMAKILVDEHLEVGHPIMGINQPQHILGDPRAVPTFEKAIELGTSGPYHEFMGEILQYLNDTREAQGKVAIHLNMIGAGNSALMDLGFSGLAGWIVGVCCRGFSCACHAIETMKRRRAWAASRSEPRVPMLDLSLIEYEGIPDREVPTKEEREAYAEEEYKKGEWKMWNL